MNDCNCTAHHQKKLSPKSSPACVRQALAFLDQTRLLLEEAARTTGSAANAHRLRKLANGLVALHSPLAIIAGYAADYDEVPR